jgi:RNA polymerase sigma factor (sigma-70 family)
MVVDSPLSAREAPMAAAPDSPDEHVDPASDSTINLIRRAQGGDTSAREALFERYRPRLHSWATRRLPRLARDGMDTQDLVQEVMLALAKSIDRFNPTHESAFPAYLRIVLRRKIIDAVRRASRRPVFDPLNEDHVDHGPSPYECLVGITLKEAYEAAFRKLTREQQTLVFLRVELDLAYKEIAEITAAPSVDAVRMATGRAVLRLSRNMPNVNS